MATTSDGDTDVPNKVGQWAMRVECAPTSASSEDRWASRPDVPAAWLLDEWKRERAGQEGER
ncbi:MAG: hypothetical protein AAGI30_08460 [Planctomycetota bacterium]